MNPRCMPKSFDVRVTERLIKHGILSSEELTAHIDALPDLADKVAECETLWPGVEKPANEAEEPATTAPSA